MSESTDRNVQNRAYCPTCKQIVTTHHEDRDGKVYLVKECDECGKSEVVVSSDAKRYREKRAMVDYPEEARQTCRMNCRECRIHKLPSLVFVDVTNRCNMNCPICLANIPAMGFRFDPPLAYFEHIFSALAQMDPKPKIQLFGGEPTVREDLIEIINLAHRKYDLNCRVVTNGLRLADEEYCKQLLATGVQVMFSFDGRHPSIYERTRKHPKAFERKLKGLQNVTSFNRNKITVMCCVAEEVNGEYMADTIALCHDYRKSIAALDLIPLTAHWGPEDVDVDSATIEDVENIMAKSVPGMEFMPAGLLFQIKTLYQTFDVDRITFGGAHPNCESVSVLISDGEKYQPASKYLKKPFEDVVMEVIALDDRMGRELEKSLWSRMFGRFGRKMKYGMELFKLVRRNLDFNQIFIGRPSLKMMRILWGLLRGVKLKTLLRTHTRCQHILRVIVLPFEEAANVEAARLVECPAAFAYEHPESHDVRFMPVCSWAIYKDDILRATAKRYGLAGTTGDEGTEALGAAGQTAPDAAG
jgi:uncharacterized radical SAM superfamily Fe-S cluster-containing enzyme